MSGWQDSTAAVTDWCGGTGRLPHTHLGKRQQVVKPQLGLGLWHMSLGMTGLQWGARTKHWRHFTRTKQNIETTTRLLIP
jgi:hypothetical protein